MYVFEGLHAGASGYLVKDVSSERLAEAIHGLARGESFLQPSVAAKVAAEFARPGCVGTVGAGGASPVRAREDLLRTLAVPPQSQSPCRRRAP